MRQSRRAASKKINYKAQDESEDEENNLDFQDSGSEASINNDTDDDDEDSADSSGDDFAETKSSVKKKTPLPKRKSCPAIPFKSLKKAMQASVDAKPEALETSFSVKDLTEQEKLLPNFLDLSESDSDSDSEVKDQKKFSELPVDYKSFIGNDFNNIDLPSSSKNPMNKDSESKMERLSDSDSSDDDTEKVSSQVDNKEVAPKKLHFENLREHNKKLEEVKKSLELYTKNHSEVKNEIYDVGALLAIGETTDNSIPKLQRPSLSDSDDEDLEEVQGETVNKNIPKGGIQVTVDLPSHVKKKKVMDMEMVLKRRINRVKKEYQVYMHQVHILCWIAHGNYLNKILNDMELMAAALSLVPSEQCYPNNRISIKYLEQISKWFCDFMAVEEDKNELKFKSRRIPLNVSLLQQINKKKMNTRKNKVLIFICLMRALGVKCRMVLNFRTVPLKPPTDELCSLSTKKVEKKGENSKYFKTKNDNKSQVDKNKKPSKKLLSINKDDKIPQVDGADDILVTKEVQTRSKRLSLQRNNQNKDKEKPSDVQKAGNSSGLSYWDKITQNIDVKSEKRVSHKDLRNSRSGIKSSVETPSAKDNENNGKKILKTVTRSSNKKTTTKDSISNMKENTISKDKRSKKSTSTVKKDEVANTAKSSNGDVLDSSFKIKKPVKRQISNQEPVKPVKSKRTENHSSVSTKIVNNSNSKKEPRETIQMDRSLCEENKRNSAGSSNSTTKSLRSINKNADSKYFKNTKKNLETKNKILNISDHDLSPMDKNVKKRKNSDASDVDFLPPKKKNIKKSGRIDRRVLSTDSEHSNEETKRKGTNVWCEVFVEEEEQWIAVDIIKGQVHCVSQIYNRANHPISYIVAWDTSNYIKDVTRRYVSHWNTTTRKLRTNASWYEKAIRPWMAPPHLRDRREDEQFDKMQLDAPMPQTVSEFKNHPLYVLKRHLLKFEVLYPPDAAILGFVRSEAVYARECVHICRSRETWVKEAKVVKPGEKPYKIVKARPKYDKLSGQMICDIPLEIFGPWQVDDYIPPKAEDGKVPRNPYGNVELFKPCMLPGGTVHITLPGLNKVAKKLGIDCAPAMVGFDYHSGGSHPVYDGFVVCEEFKESIIVAWEQEQEDAEKRAREKIEKRVYGNWKKLIRGLFIRERLQAKYDFNLGVESTSDNIKKSKKK